MGVKRQDMSGGKANWAGIVKQRYQIDGLWPYPLEERSELAVRDDLGSYESYVCHFERGDEPPAGVRIAVEGTWLTLERPLPEAERDEGMGPGWVQLQFQIVVERWVEVDADFDPLFDELEPEEWERAA